MGFLWSVATFTDNRAWLVLSWVFHSVLGALLYSEQYAYFVLALLCCCDSPCLLVYWFMWFLLCLGTLVPTGTIDARALFPITRLGSDMASAALPRCDSCCLVISCVVLAYLLIHPFVSVTPMLNFWSAISPFESLLDTTLVSRWTLPCEVLLLVLLPIWAFTGIAALVLLP
jgi:hypothetical protein